MNHIIQATTTTHHYNTNTPPTMKIHERWKMQNAQTTSGVNLIEDVTCKIKNLNLHLALKRILQSCSRIEFVLLKCIRIVISKD